MTVASCHTRSNSHSSWSWCCSCSPDGTKATWLGQQILADLQTQNPLKVKICKVFVRLLAERQVRMWNDIFGACRRQKETMFVYCNIGRDAKKKKTIVRHRAFNGMESRAEWPAENKLPCQRLKDVETVNSQWAALMGLALAFWPRKQRGAGAKPTLLEAGHNERILQIYQTAEAEVQN